MRRAFQRCSSAVPRVVLRSNNFARWQVAGHDSTVSKAVTLPNAVRHSFSQSKRTRQAAVAAQGQGQEDEAQTFTRFDELGQQNILHQNVVRALTGDMGLTNMTEVQSRTINEALSGADIIAQAKTGTGKTLAFLIPILQNTIAKQPELAQRGGFGRARASPNDIRALIISPTRELAEQIATEAKKLVRHTGLIVQTAVGGTLKKQGLANMQREGCHILVGTPGRLQDILSDPYTRVQAPNLNTLVFDEADRLLDQGFWPDIQQIMRLLPTPEENDRQTLMFSATVPKEVVRIVRDTLKPGFHFVKTVDDNEEPTHERVPQYIVETKGLENSLPAMLELCTKGIGAAKEPGARPFKAIVYFNSTAETTLAAELIRNLADQGDHGRRSRHPWEPTGVYHIHSKLTQQARTRAAENFRRARSAVLFSSDVTARGMDFPDVTHVIQVGLPTSREQYIHRIGRTGRAGKEGEGWLILNELEVDESRGRLRQLPLKPSNELTTAQLNLKEPGQVPAAAGAILTMYQNSMRNVDVEQKFKVYLAMLGVFGFFQDKQALIYAMNDLARYGWGMSSPPRISMMLASKLRLSRLDGVNLGTDLRDERPERSGSFSDRSSSRGSGDAFDQAFRGGSSNGDRRGGFPFGERRGNSFGDRRDGGSAFGGDRRGGRSSFGNERSGERSPPWRR